MAKRKKLPPIYVIIDADPIVYRSGFAAETTGYRVVAEDAEGALYEAEFWPILDAKGERITAGDQMKAWAKDKCVDITSKERLVKAEPLSHCLHLVAQQFESIRDAVCNKLGVKADRLRLRVLLTGPGNFREELAKQRPYKGNRDTSHKPEHYQAIRDYLHEVWSAEIIHGHEADDEASIAAWAQMSVADAGGYVVCTVDKDLDQVPGLHYDYAKRVFYDVDVMSGEMRFWEQCLSGDPTDNIPGCYKTAAVKAERIVRDIYSAMLPQDVGELNFENELRKVMWKAIVEHYEASQLIAGCPYLDQKAEDVALETARLVYMQQRPGELWNPPGVGHGKIGDAT
jgi:hypothetical protein